MKPGFPVARDDSHAEEAAPGIWRLRMPLEAAGLDHSNVYVIRDDDGWCAFDTGMDTLVGRGIWSAALSGRFKEGLCRIVVSHHHPDHIGLAAWLKEKTGAQVVVRPEELAAAGSAGIADPFAEPGTREFFARNGMPGADVDRTVDEIMKGFYACVIPEPTIMPGNGQRMRIGRYEFDVLVSGGHSVAQVALHDRSSGIFLSGDQMLERITPNVGLMPYGDASPLANHFRSLDAIAALGPVRVLPAHYDPYDAGLERVEALRAHHVRMLSVFREKLEGRMTGFELGEGVYGRIRDVQNRILALAETLAHLQWLEDKGDVARSERGNMYVYERTR